MCTFFLFGGSKKCFFVCASLEGNENYNIINHLKAPRLTKGKLYCLEMLKPSPILYESMGIKMEIIHSRNNPGRNNNMTLSYKQEEIFSVLQRI